MTSEDAELRARLERVAREAGASALRVASADDDEKARDRMRASFARGDLATWGYDEAYAAHATSPRTLLPDARSVVCVALAYATPRDASPAPLRGRVSNYAWSSDYHERVRTVLARVAAELDAIAGCAATTIVCDTAPLAERAFAERAGLGWTGKHTNLIVPGLGSYVFLGEIVTTVALRPDAPLKKTCGSCARCVTACPTRALRGDYTIDARLCISDLTQRAGVIPMEMRPHLGTWVWGCDLCQEVCPPTRQAGAGGDRAFAPVDADFAHPPLEALLTLRSGDYKRRFRRTAMGWRGAAVLRRNAAVALGNSLDRAGVPALEAALAKDPHPTVRGHAAWALGRLGSPRALAALRASLEREPNAMVRAEAAAALAAWETFGYSRALESGRNRRATMNRFAAIAALAGALTATPSLAAGPGPSDIASNALFRRMVALNADVQSYKANVHLDVALKTFPYISPSLDGNVYYKKPDKEAVVFDTVPALASQFKKVYPRIDPPGRWTTLYDVALVGDAGGLTTFRLVPKRNGRVDRLDVKVDDATATVRSYTWTYKDGGYVTFDQTYKTQSGDYLVEKQSGHVELPSYKADVVSNFSNYQLNVAVEDSVFAEQ